MRVTCRLNLLDVLLGPIANRFKRPDERPSERGQGVLDGGGNGWLRFPPHKPIAFETSKRLAQHFMRDALDAATQFTKPVRAFAEQPHDQRSPLVGDSVERLPRRALRCVDVVLPFRHITYAASGR